MNNVITFKRKYVEDGATLRGEAYAVYKSFIESMDRGVKAFVLLIEHNKDTIAALGSSYDGEQTLTIRLDSLSENNFTFKTERLEAKVRVDDRVVLLRIQYENIVFITDAVLCEDIFNIFEWRYVTRTKAAKETKLQLVPSAPANVVNIK